MPPNIHHGADKWTAHFAAIFAQYSFNVMGLIPGTGTASGNIGNCLRMMTLLTMLVYGMKEQGRGVLEELVPVLVSPLDIVIYLILLVIESWACYQACCARHSFVR